MGDIRLAFENRRQFGNLGGLGGVQFQRWNVRPVYRKDGLKKAFDTHHVWPADFKLRFARIWFHKRFWGRRGREGESSEGIA